MTTLLLQTQGGLNNLSESELMQPPFVKRAVNVDFADNGEIRKRPGCTKIYSGTNCHSVFRDGNSLYFVDNGALILRDIKAGTNRTLKTGLGNKQMRYVSVAGRLYFSNGVHHGSFISGKYLKWGVDAPPFQPKLTASPVGGMFKGIYFVAITWLRNGEESGTGAAVSIELSSGGGISLSQFPTPPADVDGVAVYVTSNNGKQLYLYGEYSASVSTVTIVKHISNTQLLTQFFCPPPAFNGVIAYHNGRIYGVVDNRVYYSEPQNYGLFSQENYLPFNSDVKLIISVQGALYVVADATYRIGDINQDGFPSIVEVAPFSGSGNVAFDSRQELAAWITQYGFMVATADSVQLLADGRIAADSYSGGSVMIVEQDGCKRVVGSFLR